MTNKRKKRRPDRGVRNRLWFTRFGRARLVPCRRCGRWLTFDQATVDHVWPRWMAGGDEDANLVLACAPCNWLRGTADQSEDVIDSRLWKHRLCLVTSIFYVPPRRHVRGWIR